MVLVRFICFCLFCLILWEYRRAGLYSYKENEEDVTLKSILSGKESSGGGCHESFYFTE